MPRKSAAELAIVRLEPPLQPKPPADLTAEQAAEFVSIVNHMPANWFGQESVRHSGRLFATSANAKIIAKEIEAFKPEWLRADNGLDRFEQLEQDAGSAAPHDGHASEQDAPVSIFKDKACKDNRQCAHRQARFSRGILLRERRRRLKLPMPAS